METKNYIRTVVVDAFIERTHYLLTNVNQDTEIAPDQIENVLRLVSEKIGFPVQIKRSRPKRGWKIKTLVGYIFENQPPNGT